MNIQHDRTLQEAVTTLTPAEVVRAAKQFFTRRSRLYAAFVELEGPTFVTFRGQGSEEIAIAAAPSEQGTKVSASAYLYDQQVARFLATLPPASTGATAA